MFRIQINGTGDIKMRKYYNIVVGVRKVVNMLERKKYQEKR